MLILKPQLCVKFGFPPTRNYSDLESLAQAMQMPILHPLLKVWYLITITFLIYIELNWSSFEGEKVLRA